MHEVSLMQSVLDIALEAAGRQGARRITKFRLRIGALAGVVPDALRFACDVVTRETPAAGAQLEIETVPARAACAACGAEFQPDAAGFVCPQCGASQVEILQGRELALDSIEVADDA